MGVVRLCKSFLEWLEGKFITAKNNVPHLVRKLLLGIEREMRQQGRRAAARSWASSSAEARKPVWDEYWESVTLVEIKDLMPNQKSFLEAFDDGMRAGALSEMFAGEHVFMLSCWACLMSGACKQFGAAKCFEVFADAQQVRAKIQRDAAQYGPCRPACFYTVVKEQLQGAEADDVIRV